MDAVKFLCDNIQISKDFYDKLDTAGYDFVMELDKTLVTDSSGTTVAKLSHGTVDFKKYGEVEDGKFSDDLLHFKNTLQALPCPANEKSKSKPKPKVKAASSKKSKAPTTKAKITIKAKDKTKEDVNEDSSSGLYNPVPTKGEKIPLHQATHLYQPVQGTGNSSTYHLVAASNLVRVAARILTGNLSIRVETKAGLNIQDVIPIKEGAILLPKSGGSHASVHLTVGDDIALARRTLGAVLADLEVEFKTNFPQLEKLIGEGT